MLEIKAEVTPKFRNINNGESKIEGMITITNRTSTPQKYGNKFLKLVVNENLTARTYKDTIASEIIDFAVVEIKPQSSLSLPVYWVFSVPKETEVGSLRLSIDEESLEKAEGIQKKLEFRLSRSLKKSASAQKKFLTWRPKSWAAPYSRLDV